MARPLDQHANKALVYRYSHAMALRGKVRMTESSWSKDRRTVPEPGPGEKPVAWTTRIEQLKNLSVELNEHFSATPPSDRFISLLPTETQIHAFSNNTHSITGVRPISFSFPSATISRSIPKKSRSLSSIIPGEPYGFHDSCDYYGEYERSFYAVTHRKAGWDCFRHAEILASGCLPLMLDIDAVPTHTMTHFPKAALSLIAATLLSQNVLPDSATQQAFLEFTYSTLSTKAMSRYFLRMSGLADAERVLFIDSKLPQVPDYLSLLTLIGLKEIFGSECHEWYHVDYLYSDFEGDISKLYGRGFGYGKLLSPQLKSSDTSRTGSRELKSVLHSGRFGAVVVGSAPRNPRLSRLILKHFEPSRVVLLDGEDHPPTSALLDRYASLDSNVFVREIVT